MSEETQKRIARRPVLGVMAAMIGVAAAGGIAYEMGVFGPSWPKTPYDDLLGQLQDRSDAIVVGKAVLKDDPDFNAKTVAGELRARTKTMRFAKLVEADIRSNALTEAEGWVLPTSLAQMSALAAFSTPKQPG